LIVGLIGAGNMGGAIARGWASEELGPDELLVTDADADRARELSEQVGGKRVASASELVQNVDVVLLATKPAALEPVAQEIRVAVSERQLPIVSILGATSIARIEAAFGAGTPILRFMPNVAAEVRSGTFVYAHNAALDSARARALLDLFGVLGKLVVVEEPQMDAATAISGCGPAFFALVVEALVDAGVKEGLHATQAVELALSTMAGTAALLEQRGGDTVALKRQVTSPGGTTAAGLAALERNRVRGAFVAAVEAVVKRSQDFHAASDE